MPELEQKSFQKRNIAYKIKISDILNADLNSLNIYRVNVIATLVDKVEKPNYTSSIIDDGTGRISLRSFENKSIFSKVDVGEIVLAIGKIREFNNEKYLIPEIIRKINDAQWVNGRKLEFGKSGEVVNEMAKTREAYPLEEGITNIKEEICLLIKRLDNGDGVSIDEIIKSLNNGEAESMIKKMLESGDIFEIKSGKVKVLE